MERFAQRLRGWEVPAEGLLEDNTRATGGTRLAEPLNHLSEHTRRNREIVQRVCSIAEFLAERGVGGGGAVVAADVSEPLPELRKDRFVKTVVPLDTLPGACPKLLDRPV